MATSDPTNKRSTHNIILDPGGNNEVAAVFCDARGRKAPLNIATDPLERSSLKTYSGRQKHSDMELPWNDFSQTEFSGGRGQDDFDRDETKFFDSQGLITHHGPGLCLGGQEVWLDGGRTDLVQEWHYRGNANLQVTYGSAAFVTATDFGYKFTAPCDFTEVNVYFVARANGNPTLGIDVAVYSDNAGEWNVELASTTVANTFEDDDHLWRRYRANISQALVNGTTYWIVFSKTASGDSDNCQMILTYYEALVAISDNWYYSEDNGTTQVQDTDMSPFIRITDADMASRVHMFEYKGAQFFAISYEDGTAPTLLVNGDQGVASGGTTTTLTVGSGLVTWVADEAIGNILVLVSGTGADQERNWRVITDNTAGANAVFTTDTDDPWDEAPAASTEYAVINSEVLTTIAGHGLTGPITDVLSVNGFIYFAQGESVNIRRMEIYNNAGTWTARYADDSTNKARFLQEAADEVDGAVIWKATNGPAQIAKAPAVETWGNLTFDTAIGVGGDLTERITALETYGEYGNLWVFKEASIYQVIINTPLLLPINEMKAVKDYRTGRGALMHNVYLYFALANGLESYYEGTLDNIGPNTGEGLPSGRQGCIVHQAGYPGLVLSAVDGGKWDQSSVLAYNRQG